MDRYTGQGAGQIEQRGNGAYGPGEMKALRGETSTNGAVTVAVSMLEDRLRVVASAIEELRTRLAPILTPVPPQGNSRDEVNQAGPVRSDVANVIHMLAYRAEGIHGSVKELLSRIEL